MSARANVVLPAPRSPESVTRSPGSRALAMSIASRWVACSSGSTTEKLEVPDVVGSSAMMATISRRRALGPVVEREHAGDGGAATDRRFQRHRATVQLHERAHEREAEPGPAMARAERMGLKPVEDLVLDVGRDAGTTIGHREHHGILQPPSGKGHGLAGGREAHRIGEEIEQRLAHPAL